MANSFTTSPRWNETVSSQPCIASGCSRERRQKFWTVFSVPSDFLRTGSVTLSCAKIRKTRRWWLPTLTAVASLRLSQWRKRRTVFQCQDRRGPATENESHSACWMERAVGTRLRKFRSKGAIRLQSIPLSGRASVEWSVFRTWAAWSSPLNRSRLRLAHSSGSFPTTAAQRSGSQTTWTVMARSASVWPQIRTRLRPFNRSTSAGYGSLMQAKTKTRRDRFSRQTFRKLSRGHPMERSFMRVAPEKTGTSG